MLTDVKSITMERTTDVSHEAVLAKLLKLNQTGGT